MKNALFPLVASLCLFSLSAALAADAPPATVSPNDALVLDGIPPIPAALAEKVGRYTEFRAAVLVDWHPTKRELLIGTRFADTNQVHAVKMPGGARTQLTFFPDRVEGAAYEPTEGKFFVFHKGTGGAEFFQNYRYDLVTGDVTLLTDGKSRNSMPIFSRDGKRIAYSSTRRTGTDTDLYTTDPRDPKTDKLFAEVKGGGWEPMDWSPDGKQLLVLEFVSINESYLWLFDAQTGQKTELTPRRPEGSEKVFYGRAEFAKDGKGFYVITDNGGEFQRLAYVDLATKQGTYVTPEAAADVENFDLSEDGTKLALSLNDQGSSRLEIYAVKGATNLEKITAGHGKGGVISQLKWHRNSRTLGWSQVSANSSSDVFSTEITGDGTRSRDLSAERWTESETGGLNAAAFAKPTLVKWKSFDGREISGFLYQPDAKKFAGKRPVIINIHGGPEAQYRPGYLGRNNYLINELGCAILFPNIRGSSGYGKTFVALDNGYKREDSYKDIDALFTWIRSAQGPAVALDPDRIMVTGGSYGGHMTLAVSTFYADKIRCALDVVGISNLKTFLLNTESYRRDLRRVEYGDERDPKMAEFLDRIAPLNNAQKITKPLFVVQGANDPRVPKSEADQIVATLKKQGTPVWYLLAKDEGHGFAKKKNADFQFYATVEFIRRHLLDETGAR